ncbi:hypothetical protein [Halobacteriovorax sp. HLS]|uniref:hypothetical protein n=1 Tax=Halobacteriovorax sp. HLS TaxID=2234000 RepID=UPI000FDBAFF6|nr:hypothetical protein [Halobacteriovorax sp. HLS]
MDLTFFIIKYIPFWSVPSIIIAGYFCYLYWVKDIRLIAVAFGMTAFISFLSLGYWVMSGGPNQSVQQILEFQKQDM